MSLELKKRILQKIKEYNKIIISRHVRPDGDCIGGTKGLKEILTLTYPEKEIYLVNEDYSEYLAFLGGEDAQFEDEFYSDALVIVLDTASTDRISNKKYNLGKELIKIDHHIDIKPYGDISWVEDWRSSLCEMIVDFYDTFSDELKINSMGATYLYTGMVTDSGRFRHNTVTGTTLRLAGLMLDKGINTEWLHANLKMEEYNQLQFKAYALGQIKVTENGVAYIYVDKEMQEKFNLSREDASASVAFAENIKGSLIWVAFIDNADGTIRVRLRSRFLTCNDIGENWRGGGHECACGATLHSADEIDKLLLEADAKLKEYKATHEGWL
ncbi:MAG: bifunctional oligoribonuclease/PAP phosphatase NrnA [Clostridia bacterium]|nr:bifunctional oligoribonuclease/PAP phosphatase NrnA [Clostridia bacterium]